MTRVLCCSLAVIALVRVASAGEHKPAGVGESVPSVEELERNVLGYRRAIQTGRVVLTAQMTTCLVDPKYTKFRQQYALFFKPGKVRMDSKCTVVGQEGEVLEHRLMTEDQVIHVPDAKHAAVVEGRRGRTPSDASIINPLLLGMYPACVQALWGNNLDEFLLRSDRKDLRIEKDTLEGEHVWRVTYKFIADYDQQVRYWISPRQGWGMLRFESDRDFGTYRRQHRLRVDFSRYEQGGVWFPNKVVFQAAKDGKLEEEEIVLVQEAVFGGAMPDETFTIAALGLPAGREFGLDGRAMVWNGESLADRSPHTEFPDPSEPDTSARLRFVLGAGLLAALSLVLLWTWRRGVCARRESP